MNKPHRNRRGDEFSVNLTAVAKIIYRHIYYFIYYLFVYNYMYIYYLCIYILYTYTNTHTKREKVCDPIKACVRSNWRFVNISAKYCHQFFNFSNRYDYLAPGNSERVKEGCEAVPLTSRWNSAQPWPFSGNVLPFASSLMLLKPPPRCVMFDECWEAGLVPDEKVQAFRKDRLARAWRHGQLCTTSGFWVNCNSFLMSLFLIGMLCGLASK